MFRNVVITLVLSVLSGTLALKTHQSNLHEEQLLQVAHGEAAKIEAASLERHREAATEVFPVPTTARCIVIMVCQYMIIYTALAVCRTYHEFSGTPKGKVEAGLKAASETLTYAPMLCVLFIACRMRVEFLSTGKDQPQMWVQHCMYALTFSVLATTLMVLFLPFLTGKPLALKEGSCDLEQPAPEDGHSNAAFWALTVARCVILLSLYGGLAGVILGINIYLPPGATDLDALPPPAPAIQCTMILTVFFFTIQLVLAACRSSKEFTGVESPKLIGVMHGAANTVEFAPMLSIVFLAARMRALQHDGQPQRWAQDCMFASTYAMCTTTILAILVPLALGGSVRTDPKTNQTFFEAGDSHMLGYALIGVRYLCMIAFYSGVLGVIVSILVFEAPAGADATLPVSPTVQCVIMLTCQYFFVYAVLISCHTVSELTGGKLPVESYKFYSAVDATKATIAFAPMLSILFVTTRMYALLITNKKGAPQGWVQDGMYMATWSLFISFLSCLVTAFAMDDVQRDENGNVTNRFANVWVATSMTILRYVTMLLLYGGIAIIIVGLFVMTPETANGHGSVLSEAVN